VDAAIVNRFFSATTQILSGYFGIEVSGAGQPRIVLPSADLDPITVLLSLTGDLEGQFVLGYDPAVALGIARSMLGRPAAALDNLGLSALGELSNLIAGRTATELAGMGYFCGIAPPLVLQGGNGGTMQFSAPHLIALPIQSGAGQFHVYIGLKKHEA
jgi:chemotaxis protein CheX